MSRPSGPFTGTMLVGNGHEVELAGDGLVALHKLDQETFDLLILDLRMPELDGFEVLKALAANPDERIPVIVMTGYFTNEEARQGVAGLGVHKILIKPVMISTLLQVVRGFDPA